MSNTPPTPVQSVDQLLNGPGAMPFSQNSSPTFILLLGSVTAYAVAISDVVIDYTGTATGRTANLPAATGSGRTLRFTNGPLGSSANALTIQPAGTDAIGGGLPAVAGAGGAVVLQGGDSWILIQDSAAGKWTIEDRSTNNVTSAKTGTAYVIAETDDIIPVNSTATVTVTLPLTPVIGESHLVVDTIDASMQTITVARNGQLINGAAANKTITTLLGAKRFTFVGAPLGWYEQQAIP